MLYAAFVEPSGQLPVGRRNAVVPIVTCLAPRLRVLVMCLSLFQKGDYKVEVWVAVYRMDS